MKISIPNAVSHRVATTALRAQKNSPKILFVAGIALMGGTVVTACKATLELPETLEEIEHTHEKIKAAALRSPGKYDEKRLHAYATGRGIARIAKLYLPSIALGVAAVSCLTKSHNILTRRNAGLSAALAATERALDAYRGRVRDQYGEDAENKLWRGEGEKKVPVIDDEGRETKSKAVQKFGGGYSPYARVWGKDTSSEWDPQPQFNLPKLRSTQEYGKILLDQKGYLFLNDIYEQLGLSKTSAGQVVGWVSKKNGGTDGYIDFGVLKQDNEGGFVDFVTGDQDHIMLDFNVDGEIWRLLDELND